MPMRVVLTISGAIIGVLVDLVSPWSDIIMGSVQNVLANESVHNYPGLPLLLNFLGVFTAYVMPPLIGGVIGFRLGSQQ